MLEIDLNLMIAYNLTLEEYVLLLLLKKKDYKLVHLYFNSFAKLLELLNSLVEKKFIILEKFTNADIIENYKVILIPQYSGSSMETKFEELTIAYPTKVTRPDGNEDYLLSNIIKCKELYRKMLKKEGQDAHEKIIRALKYQVEMLTRTGSLKYMQKLHNWLVNETWKDYEILSRDKKPLTSSLNNTYGQKLI